MDEDVFRVLCIALRKASEGKPVAIDDEEHRAPFELSLKIAGDGVVVQVLDGDD